jgi:predicted transcriptional regulator
MKNVTPQLYEAILDQVRHKLGANQLTQAQIGKALGMKQSAVSYLLKGKTRLSLEQFLELSELIGERPQQIIAQAESGLTDKRPMPADKEEIIGKSLEHYLCYFGAIRMVKPEDFSNSFFPLEKIRSAFEDLVRADLLDRLPDGFYRQKQVNVVFTAPTEADRVKRNQFLLELLIISHKIWHKRQSDKAYKSTRFNYIMMDHFTNAQIREVTDILWRAHEKIIAIRKQNMANGYNAGSEKFSLWQANFMLMTPLEEK